MNFLSKENVNTISSRIYSLDIETEPISNDPQAFEKKHALIPHLSRITKIGLVNYNLDTQLVFNNVAELKNHLEVNLEGEYYLVGHNFKFDLKHLHFHGYSIPIDRWLGCTQILANCLNKSVPQKYIENYERARQLENLKIKGKKHREARGLSLKVLAPYYLGVEPFWEDPNNHNDDTYVLKDTEYTMRLYKHLVEIITEEDWEFYVTKHLPWAKELYKAELTGVKLDMNKVNQKEKEYQELSEKYGQLVIEKWLDVQTAFYKIKAEKVRARYATMQQKAIEKGHDPDKVRARYKKLEQDKFKKIAATGGFTLNLNSPTQLKWALKYRGYDVTNFFGKESTEAEVLKKLSVEHEDVKALLEYRKYKKLETTYIPSYKELSVNGRIHASFNSTGTRTGRVSGSFPNLQNQPAEVRDCFIADDEHTFVIRDYSAIEPRVLAYFSEDPLLLKCMIEGEDFHGTTAKAIFNYIDCPSWEIKEKFPRERAVSKTCGLAILYGAGANRLHKTLFEKGFTSYTKENCYSIVEDIRQTYKGVWNFKTYLDNLLKEGRVLHNLLGRPLYIENPEDIYMKGLNTLIQGSASDLVQDSFKKINDSVSHLGGQCLITVHDEIIMQAPDKNLDKCVEIMENVMITSNKLILDNGLEIPIKIEGEESKVWVK